MTNPRSAAHGKDPGVIRIATLMAAPGKMPDLITAALTNATEARAADGCLTAEVAHIPDSETTLTVISRWSSRDALDAFLGWHEGIAHRLIKAASGQAPQATHYPIIAAPH